MVYGFSAVAQILVVLKFAHAPTPLGQAAGAGNAPRFIAPLHASFAGAAPPLHDGQAEPGQGTHERIASNPGLRCELSEVNSKVKQPVVDVSIPGIVVPVYVPNTGAPVFDPL